MELLQENEVEAKVLKRVLLSVPDDDALVYAIVLDWLNGATDRRESIGQLGDVISSGEPLLTSSEKKMFGVLMALREFRIFYPLDYNIINALRTVLEEVLIDARAPEKPWVHDALVLLSQYFYPDLLRGFLSIAKAKPPFGLAPGYLESFAETIAVMVRTGLAVDPEMPRMIQDEVEELKCVIDERTSDTNQELCIRLSTQFEDSLRAHEGHARGAEFMPDANKGPTHEFSEKLSLYLALMTFFPFFVLLAMLFIPKIVHNWAWLSPHVKCINFFAFLICFYISIVLGPSCLKSLYRWLGNRRRAFWRLFFPYFKLVMKSWHEES